MQSCGKKLLGELIFFPFFSDFFPQNLAGRVVVAEVSLSGKTGERNEKVRRPGKMQGKKVWGYFFSTYSVSLSHSPCANGWKKKRTRIRRKESQFRPCEKVAPVPFRSVKSLGFKQKNVPPRLKLLLLSSEKN